LSASTYWNGLKKYLISLLYIEGRNKMKKKVLHGTFFLVFWIIFNLTAGWAQQPIGPRMELKEKYFNANSLKEGQIIEHTFTVFNRGDRPLEIKKVQPG